MKIFIPGCFMLLLFSLSSCTEEFKVTEETYADGTPKLISTYQGSENDKEKMSEVHYFENGMIKMKGNYKNGKRDGNWQSYHPNGNLWSTAVYEEGIRNGKSEVFYENGAIHIKGQFRNDRASGIWRWYDEKGNELKQIDYKH